MDIQQASIYSGKSERTIRRWIVKAKTLPAQKIAGKYDIQASDLDPLLVQPAPDTLSERIAALESRVSALEGLLQEMSSNPPMRRLGPPRPVYEHSDVSEGKGMSRTTQWRRAKQQREGKL